MRFILIVILFQSVTFSQIENVPIDNGVYTFLKEMKVKGILSFIREDDPILSRYEVKNLLDEISKQQIDLSNTEKKLLNKYYLDYLDSEHPDTSTQLFNSRSSFLSDLDQMYSDKIKYLYMYKEPNANVYFEWLGHFYHGQDFTQENAINSNLYDIGFRIRGTVAKNLGYNLTVIKGGVSGDKNLAEVIEPRLLTSFKWIEDTENIGNYDFTYGYLKYHTEPILGMNLSFQLGREDITLGYGYGSKLVLSGDNPTMDFFKFNFDYGIISFSSIHASTVGYFNFDPEERYSKYYAFNHLKLKFKKLFDIGIGESVVYSGRGLELGYFAPVTFYKFIEMGTQDRDNGNIYFDLQTKFVKNLEIQATFLLDENILSNLGDLEKYTNKTAYQLGAFWYNPIGISDLSLIVEYTKIRPYVYTHFNIKNNYTAYGTNLGHRIGPNADEILIRSNYNFNEWLRGTIEYRHQREGNNLFDDDGTMIKNVGGDIALTHGYVIQTDRAFFLDGEKVNTDFFSFGFRIEPLRDYIFDISYNYSQQKNHTKNLTDELSYLLFRFTLEY